MLSKNASTLNTSINMFVQANYQAEAHTIKTIFTSCNKNKTSQNATRRHERQELSSSD